MEQVILQYSLPISIFSFLIFCICFVVISIRWADKNTEKHSYLMLIFISYLIFLVFIHTTTYSSAYESGYEQGHIDTEKEELIYKQDGSLEIIKPN